MSKTRVSLLLIVSFFLTTNICLAQDTFEPGFVILKDGTRAAGLIRISSSYGYLNQRFIWMKDSTEITSNPNNDIRGKKIKVDAMQLYYVNQRTFENIKYIDYENLQVKSLGSNEHMLERFTSGILTSYRYYPYPKDVYLYLGSESEVNNAVNEDTNDLLKWKLLTRKTPDDKFRDAFDYDILKYFEDTPTVLEKYKTGGYGNEPMSTKKGLAAKMINLAKKETYMRVQYKSVIAAYNEYNEINLKK